MADPYQCQLLYNGQPVTVVLPNLAVPKCEPKERELTGDEKVP